MNLPSLGIGGIIALLVLVVCVVLWVVGGVPQPILGLIAALAIARLV
jgi:hypothetical protein